MNQQAQNALNTMGLAQRFFASNNPVAKSIVDSKISYPKFNNKIVDTVLNALSTGGNIGLNLVRSPIVGDVAQNRQVTALAQKPDLSEAEKAYLDKVTKNNILNTAIAGTVGIKSVNKLDPVSEVAKPNNIKAMINKIRSDVKPSSSVDEVLSKVETRGTDLIQEARKYKSAEEFVKAEFVKSKDYVSNKSDIEGFFKKDGDGYLFDTATVKANKKINKDGTIELVHLTTPEGKMGIEKEGFNKGTWFGLHNNRSISRPGAEPTVTMKIKVDPSDIAFGRYAINRSKLVKGSDGVYRSEKASQLTDIWNKARGITTLSNIAGDVSANNLAKEVVRGKKPIDQTIENVLSGNFGRR